MYEELFEGLKKEDYAYVPPDERKEKLAGTLEETVTRCNTLHFQQLDLWQLARNQHMPDRPCCFEQKLTDFLMDLSDVNGYLVAPHDREDFDLLKAMGDVRSRLSQAFEAFDVNDMTGKGWVGFYVSRHRTNILDVSREIGGQIFKALGQVAFLDWPKEPGFDPKVEGKMLSENMLLEGKKSEMKDEQMYLKLFEYLMKRLPKGRIKDNYSLLTKRLFHAFMVNGHKRFDRETFIDGLPEDIDSMELAIFFHLCNDTLTQLGLPMRFNLFTGLDQTDKSPNYSGLRAPFRENITEDLGSLSFEEFAKLVEFEEYMRNISSEENADRWGFKGGGFKETGRELFKQFFEQLTTNRPLNFRKLVNNYGKSKFDFGGFIGGVDKHFVSKGLPLKVGYDQWFCRKRPRDDGLIELQLVDLRNLPEMINRK